MSGKRLNVVWSVLTKRWVSYPATVHRCFVPALPITQPARLSGSTLDMSPKWIIPEKATSNPLRSSLEQFNFLAEEVTGENGEAEQRGTGRASPVMLMGFYFLLVLTCEPRVSVREVLLALQFDVVQDDHLFMCRERAIHLYLGKTIFKKQPKNSN